MKRNSVVVFKGDDAAMMSMYGRISRMIGKHHAEVVDCGRFRSVYPIKHLEEMDYKGTWYWTTENGERIERWSAMPTLRKLKQMSRRYDPAVWKKNRPKNIMDETWPNSDRYHTEIHSIALLYGLDD